MSNPFLAEIRMVGFTFPPKGWADCNGQLLAISQNTALFSLLGTTYGGNGQTTFALPDLQSRVAVHHGQGPGLSDHFIGEQDGVESVTLSSTTIPAHNHGGTLLSTAAVGTSTNPAGNVPATPNASPRVNKLYSTAAGDTVNTSSLTSVGATSPSSHNNLMPFLCVRYIIALQGIFPPRQ